MGYQNKGSWQAVPVEDIRASSITYEQLMMRCFDRLDAIISTAAKEELYSLVEAKIRYVDSLMNPYWCEDKRYKEERLKIIKRLQGTGEDGFPKYVVLMYWLRLLTTRFSKMNILPEKRISVIAGIGEVKENMDVDEPEEPDDQSESPLEEPEYVEP